MAPSLTDTRSSITAENPLSSEDQRSPDNRRGS